jgi:hypothetical protein
MKKTILTLVAVVMIANLSYAQVAITENGSLPDNSAMLDVKSTDKGILIPRMTAAERDAINSPANGLLVFVTTDDQFYYNKGTSSSPNWTKVDGDSDWTISGNNMYSAVSGNVGIGTNSPDAALEVTQNDWEDIVKIHHYTSSNALIFSSGNSYASISGSPTNRNDIVLSHLTGNIGIGTTSPAEKLHIIGSMRMEDGNQASGKVMMSNTYGTASWQDLPVVTYELNDLSDSRTSSDNLFLGENAGNNSASNYAHNNTAIGINALQDNYSGGNNIAIGTGAAKNTVRFGNIAIGTASLYNNETGMYNIAIGDSAMYNTDANAYYGHYNNAIGTKALFSNISGNANTAFGTYALQSNISGSTNIAVGHYAGRSVLGEGNVLLGTSAGSRIINGDGNTAIGDQAGQGVIGDDGFSGGVFIGSNAGMNNTEDNKLFIDNSSTNTPLIGGDFDTDELHFNTTKVGIGTNAPNEHLEVASPTGSHGRLIVSDGGGADRNVILLTSPNSSSQYARIEAYKYGTGTGGLTLKINNIGGGKVVFGGNVEPISHKGKDLGSDTKAWDNVYVDDLINLGAAAFANIHITEQLLNYPPSEKKAGAFDEYTDKGLKELDPASLPEALTEDNGILIDEMTTYNYKANYEQQQQIENLKAENASLKARLEKIEKFITK